MPDEDKTFSGSLVLDLRIWWRHVHTIDCMAGNTAEEQNLLANISTSRASLLQGQYLIQEK